MTRTVSGHGVHLSYGHIHTLYSSVMIAAWMARLQSIKELARALVTNNLQQLHDWGDLWKAAMAWKKADIAWYLILFGRLWPGLKHA